MRFRLRAEAGGNALVERLPDAKGISVSLAEAGTRMAAEDTLFPERRGGALLLDARGSRWLAMDLVRRTGLSAAPFAPRYYRRAPTSHGFNEGNLEMAALILSKFA